MISERVNTDAVDPQVRRSVEQAIAVLGELGAEIQDVSIPLIVQSAVISSAVIMVDAIAPHGEGIANHLGDYDHNNRVRLLTGSIMPSRAHQKAMRLREVLRQQILAALQPFSEGSSYSISFGRNPRPLLGRDGHTHRVWRNQN